MNYYERHIGDYLKDTAHLSLLEHGIYGRLLDIYYSREAAIPSDQIARLVGAKSKDEREALDSVLKEFFVLGDGGWSQSRCDQEIARYRDKQNKARASALVGVAARRDKAEMTDRELRSARMAAAKAQGTHTKEEWAALREFCGHKCVRCGASGHQDRDHIIPVYQGGSDSISNIQPLCAHCNASKGSENADHRPSGWQAFVERSLCDRSAPSNQTPVTSAEANASVGSAKPRPVRKCPESFVVDDELTRWAMEKVPGLALDRETEKFRDHTFRAALSDWRGAWRNWMRRAAEASSARGQLLPSTAVTVPSPAADKTAEYLRSRELTPEEKEASEKARRAVMASIKVVHTR